MSKFGPSKNELKFRLYASIAGLALLVGALLFKGVPSGPAFFEVVVVAGGFFGGTIVWMIYRLRKGLHADNVD